MDRKHWIYTCTIHSMGVLSGDPQCRVVQPGHPDRMVLVYTLGIQVPSQKVFGMGRVQVPSEVRYDWIPRDRKKG